MAVPRTSWLRLRGGGRVIECHRALSSLLLLLLLLLLLCFVARFGDSKLDRDAWTNVECERGTRRRQGKGTWGSPERYALLCAGGR
jgi:hypothetical protein